ncbi:hypothetical protein [Campylobacter volucris]|uniref:hypothetical protein n=1 Tax=Campylobacter volucris TaxID=1031542 RepID=UPI001E500DCC|nr:hypothetical protein [Campylobacter volucris]
MLLKKKASKLETLASNYGGIYIFDKKIREEILENERKIKEYNQWINNISASDEELRANDVEKNSFKSFLMVVNIIVVIIDIKVKLILVSKINPNLHTMKINLKHTWVKKTIKN